MKKFYSWKSLVKSGLHDHNRAAFFVKSFLPEVISRLQLPQNSKILYLVLEKGYSKTGMGVTGVSSLCVLF